ncbi:MAG: DUF1573 domain-containing protein [Desulfobulbaceae bacterium]|nr:DUF1573 domain-containing protein [Desulfobulbaceae bacterium]
MSKRSIYTCDNEHGNDPCQLGGREISDADFKISFDIDKKPKCPGKTISGNDCPDNLHFLRVEVDDWWKWLKRISIGGGVLAALTLIAFAGYWMMGGGGPLMKVEPGTLTFPLAEAGAASANLQVRNNGDGELVIERIEVNPSVFSTSKDKMQIEPNDTATLFVHFKSPSAEKMEGELVLHGNAPNSPLTVRLIANQDPANQDPWKVYQQLEKSSKILSTEP